MGKKKKRSIYKRFLVYKEGEWWVKAANGMYMCLSPGWMSWTEDNVRFLAGFDTQDDAIAEAESRIDPKKVELKWEQS